MTPTLYDVHRPCLRRQRPAMATRRQWLYASAWWLLALLIALAAR